MRVKWGGQVTCNGVWTDTYIQKFGGEKCQLIGPEQRWQTIIKRGLNGLEKENVERIILLRRGRSDRVLWTPVSTIAQNFWTNWALIGLSPTSLIRLQKFADIYHRFRKHQGMSAIKWKHGWGCTYTVGCTPLNSLGSTTGTSHSSLAEVIK
jgi:hypothetical protein